MTTKLGKGYGNVGGDCRLRWLKDYNGTVIRLDQRFGALWLWLELVAYFINICGNCFFFSQKFGLTKSSFNTRKYFEIFV